MLKKMTPDQMTHDQMAQDHWSAENYATHGNFVSAHHDVVLGDLAPQKGETILDIGCGDGEIAVFLMELGCHIIGIDSSPSLIAKAKERGVDARVADAQTLDAQTLDAQTLEFCTQFDAVFSNAALHWMLRQSDVCDGVFRALKAGGRFVAEMGGAGNIAQIRRAMKIAFDEVGYDFDSINPWIFPSEAEQTARLEASGFRVQKCQLRERPVLLPTDIHGWLDTFGSAIFSHLAAELRTEVTARIVDLCRPALQKPDGRWMADYVRLNFIATKPE